MEISSADFDTHSNTHAHINRKWKKEWEGKRKKLWLNVAREKVSETKTHSKHVCVRAMWMCLKIYCVQVILYEIQQSATHSFVHSFSHFKIENSMKMRCRRCREQWEVATNSEWTENRESVISKDRETNECACVCGNIAHQCDCVRICVWRFEFDFRENIIWTFKAVTPSNHSNFKKKVVKPQSRCDKTWIYK